MVPHVISSALDSYDKRVPPKKFSGSQRTDVSFILGKMLALYSNEQLSDFSLLKLDLSLLVAGKRKLKTAKVETLKPPTTLINPSPVHVTRCLHVGDQPRYWVVTELGVTCICRSGTCPNETKLSIREQSSCFAKGLGQDFTSGIPEGALPSES